VQLTDSISLMNPRAVAVGETLHVVASSGSSSFYLRSNDNGATWTEPIVPADILYRIYLPYITSSHNYIHLTFIGRSESGQPLQTYHMSSSDGGRTWGEPHQVFNHEGPAFFKYPRIAVNGDTLFLSVVRYPYLITFRSFDNGVTWQDSTTVENGSIIIDAPPSILYSQERLHLVYQLNLIGDSMGIEIYHRFSDDYGLTWTDRYPLSEPEQYPNIKHGQVPSAFIDSDGNIIGAWYDYKYGSYCGFTGDILARISTDNGQTWLPESRITYTQSGSRSSCIILNNKIYAVWNDYYPLGCSCAKIMYSESGDWGVSWTEPEVISGATETMELSPALVYTINSIDTIFHCIISKYYDEPTRSDLFYFRSEEFTSVEFDEINILPKDLEISIYPNPFNSSTRITFENWEGGYINIDIFNLSGQKIKFYKSGEQKGGTIVWDGTDAAANKISSGIYFVRVSAPKRTKTIKLIYLR